MFDFRTDVCDSAQRKRALSASDSGPTPRRAKRNFLSVKAITISQSVSTVLRDDLGLEYLHRAVATDVDGAKEVRKIASTLPET